MPDDNKLNEQYHPEKIERLVQDYWENNKSFAVNENSNKEKFYCLSKNLISFLQFWDNLFFLSFA